MDTVRIGLIGLGNIGAFHAGYLRAGEIVGGELTAVCDGVPSRLAEWSHLPTFERSEELIRSGLVDAVLVATPSFTHAPIAIDALEHGLHVLVEKPLALQVADGQRMVAAARQADRLLAVMHNQRTLPAHRKVKQLIDAGELGAIQRLLWVITDWFRPEAYYASGGWRATWKGEGGGVLMNQAPHQLDLLQWLLGLPSSVRAFCGLGKYHAIEVEDEVTAYLAYPNGATGVFITTTGEAPGINRLEIVGTRATLTLRGGEITMVRNEVDADAFAHSTDQPFGVPDAWQVQVPVKGTGGGHREVTQNLVDALRHDAPLIAPADDALHAVELANAMLYSHFTGTVVSLPLDSQAYTRHLETLIAISTERRQVTAVRVADITQSFRS
jgi:predicted dehydrogenase